MPRVADDQDAFEPKTIVQDANTLVLHIAFRMPSLASRSDMNTLAQCNPMKWQHGHIEAVTRNGKAST